MNCTLNLVDRTCDISKTYFNWVIFLIGGIMCYRNNIHHTFYLIFLALLYLQGFPVSARELVILCWRRDNKFSLVWIFGYRIWEVSIVIRVLSYSFRLLGRIILKPAGQVDILRYKDDIDVKWRKTNGIIKTCFCHERASGHKGKYVSNAG